MTTINFSENIRFESLETNIFYIYKFYFLMIPKNFKFSTDYHYSRYYRYADVLNKKYDYKAYGIVNKTFPAFMTNSNNKILTRLMKFIDVWSITILMMVERVHDFKNIYKH